MSKIPGINLRRDTFRRDREKQDCLYPRLAYVWRTLRRGLWPSHEPPLFSSCVSIYNGRSRDSIEREVYSANNNR